jgi:hypothetical protein
MRTVRFAGWTLRQAVRRTVDPKVLAECRQAVGAWREAGAPTRFVWHNPDVEGADAERGNARTRQRRGLMNAQKAAAHGVSEALKKHLREGRLTGWGRRGSPTEQLKPIPATAWDALRLKNFSKSIAVEATASRTPLFDVRIFPVVEDPNAIEHLTDIPLIQAFRDFVFGDPQHDIMVERAKVMKGDPRQLGFQRRYLHAIWPVDYGRHSAWRSPIGFLNFKPQSRLADLVLGRRFMRLIGHLASGAIQVEGVPRSGSGTVEVPRSLWVRELTHIDLVNGDILDYQPNGEGDGFSTPVFMGLMLRRPRGAESVSHVKPTSHHQLPPDTTYKHARGRKSLDKAEGSQAAERACVEWLAAIMSGSPTERTRSGNDLWREARQKWPRILSERAFDRAKAAAISNTGATAWGAAGAPKKSPQQNRRTSP